MSKKVIIIRGPQGAGKTTLVRRAGLDGHAISFDRIRAVLSGDQLSPSGMFTPNHDNAPLMISIFRDSIDRRISEGQVVCVEGTLANGSEVYDIWKRFDEAGYEGLLIDLYGFDDELRMQRNAKRIEREFVPESSVESMKSMAKRAPVPPVMLNNPRMSSVSPKNDEDANRAISAISDFLPDARCSRDLSSYEEVIHIGDIQGCADPLTSPMSPLSGGLKNDRFYVFLGDLFDRGKQNGEVARWFSDNALGKPNVVLISGNHEDYVNRQALAADDDIDLPKSEWTRFSWPQIKAAGFDRRFCADVTAFAQDYLSYEWRGRRVLCSHAGFGRWPSRMDLISVTQMRKGSGRFSLDVDHEWAVNEAATGRFQVHGHRNENMKPIAASDLSFNLESQVEFGGTMSFLSLSKDGWTPMSVRSKTYRSMQEDVMLNRQVDREPATRLPPMMRWADVGAVPEPVSEQTLRKIRDHDMIQVKPLGDGVVSVNFTRDAFYGAKWDEYTTLARGLFLDSETGAVVARSYPKFFNHDERPETTSDGLRARVKFPVCAYEKRNGFLCITGYNDRTAEVVIASKSTTRGTFANIAREILLEAVGEGGIERIMRFNRDQVASLLFEIEDPVRDPHIIKLDKPSAVLIGCVRRSEEFEQASYDELKKIASWVGCDVKRQIARITSPEALASFNRRVESDPKWSFDGRRIEGAVLEDSDMFFYKLKGHYYRNWKMARSAVEEISNAKTSGREPRLDRFSGMDREFVDFISWAKTLSVAALRLDIISLRESFQTDRAVEELKDDVDLDAERMEKKAKAAADDFLALVRKLDQNDRISPEGLGRFIRSSLENPEKAEVLRSYENYDEMLRRSDVPEDSPSP